MMITFFTSHLRVGIKKLQNVCTLDGLGYAVVVAFDGLGMAV
jgi:hypothetical protein